MKKLLFPAELVLFFASFDKWGNFCIFAPLTGTFNFSPDSSGHHLRNTPVISPNNVSELQGYPDLIKKFTIKAIKSKMEDFQGAFQCNFNGEIKFSNKDDSRG